MTAPPAPMTIVPSGHASRRAAAGALVAYAVLTSPAHATLPASDPPLTHSWQLIDSVNWQIISGAVEDAAVTDAAEGTRGTCPMGMVDVTGAMKRDSQLSVETLQDTTCTEWISRNFPQRCARFDAKRWQSLASGLASSAMHFCIDRFEYPNRRGAYPIIAITFDEAAAVCSRDKKRLCTEDEWTFACEGKDALPYPYGYERDATACVIDRSYRMFDADRLGPRDSPRAVAELDRLWQGEPSGARASCRSPFGVYDLTGNIDEWTRATQPGRPSILKGGYWGPVRTRCRPSTRAHGTDFFFYQQGFRCCADATK